MTDAPGDNAAIISSPGGGRRLILKEALEIHRALFELFERFGVAISTSDLLLIGTGALHLCNIPTRLTADLDFLVRRVSAVELGKALAPLIKDRIVHQYAPHVFGLAVGGKFECDLISKHERGVHEAILDALFERAQVFGSLKCASPGDIFALKVAAFADRLLRSGSAARIAKYRRDVYELASRLKLEIDLDRVEMLLRRYDPAICETALRIVASFRIQRHGAPVFSCAINRSGP